MKNKIKIYTHQKQSFRSKNKLGSILAQVPKLISKFFYGFFYYTGLGVIKILTFLKNIPYKISLFFGSAIFNSAVKVFKQFKDEIYKTKLSLPKRFKTLKTAQFARTMVLFAISAGVAWAFIGSLHLVARGLQIKDKILATAFWGNNYLTEAKTALTSQDFSQAQNRFELAYKTFSQGKADIEQSEKVLNNLLSVLPQKKDADNMLVAAGFIAQAGQNFVALDEQFQNLRITNSGIAQNQNGTTALFDNISEQLSEAKNNVTQANGIIAKVNSNNLPSDKRVAFVQLQDQLSNAETAVNNFSNVFELVKSVLIGNKSILIVFENNNELRASGGFIGTFGMVKVSDGTIQKINVSSVYDLDGQLKVAVKPPKPILNVSDKWFLRDSNWFADFPTSAQKISDFYEQEGGETPDMIVAITPNLIVDWLKIFGPISLPKYNVTLTSDNFIEQTQVASTLSNNLSTNSPKQILADLVPILLQKISQLDKSLTPQLVQNLQDNLNAKQIAIYSRDPEIEKQLQTFNWGGNVAQSDRDYLSVVSSNLGGTKTDLNIDQKVSLETTINSDNSISNELTITRTNKLPRLEATNNLSFIRIYAPLGSQLVSNIGFDYKNLDYPEGEKYKIDDQTYDWEKNSVTDNLTGTTIGAESGKTYFGNWLSLNGGETKTIKLVYKLPFKLNSIDRYSLLIQKQIGSTNQSYKWTLNFPNFQIPWKNFDTQTLNTDSLISDIILSRDYFLGMVLQKR